MLRRLVNHAAVRSSALLSCPARPAIAFDNNAILAEKAKSEESSSRGNPTR